MAPQNVIWKFLKTPLISAQFFKTPLISAQFFKTPLISAQFFKTPLISENFGEILLQFCDFLKIPWIFLKFCGNSWKFHDFFCWKFLKIENFWNFLGLKPSKISEIFNFQEFSKKIMKFSWISIKFQKNPRNFQKKIGPVG